MPERALEQPGGSDQYSNLALNGGQFSRMATMYTYYKLEKYGYHVTLGSTSMKLVPDVIMTSVDEQGRLTIPGVSAGWPSGDF